jgi:TatD DNase family protein
MKDFIKTQNIVIDSHCHLNMIKEDLDTVINNAQQNNVKYMLTICTELADVDSIKSIEQKYPNVFCSFGIHPHETEKDLLSIEQIIDYAKDTNAVAIGETGLDYFYEHSNREIQKQSFKNHIIAASKLDLPIIIHTRDAEDDTMLILDEMREKYPFKAIFHCFSSDIRLAEYAVEKGIYMSASGILTFKKSESVRDSFRIIPTDLLLVETDSPFLAPVPFRGNECQPVMTNHTLQVLADLHHIGLEDMAVITTNNFKTLFKNVIK